jgi:hypothetical protein
LLLLCRAAVDTLRTHFLAAHVGKQRVNYPQSKGGYHVLSNSRLSTSLNFGHWCSVQLIVLAIALLGVQRDLFAQQGTLTDNATYPTSVSALTVRGSDVVEGSADSFIKFKLTPNLPPATPGSFVAKAMLTLFVGSVNSAGSFNVYRVTSSWAEGDTTAPTYDIANPIVVGVPVTTANSYVTIDLTTLVAQWLGTDGLGAGGVENYGVALVASTPATAFSLDSKESVTTSHPARLTFVLNHVATADTATDFTGPLAGDVTGTKNATVVSSVGSQSAASVANSTIAVNSATDANTPDTIVKRDAAGNFSAGTIAGNIAGNAATATNATNATVAKSLERAAQDADIVSPVDGQVYYNTTSNVFKIFDATTSTWKVVDAGGATTLSSLGTINGSQISGVLTNATISGDRVTGEVAIATNAITAGDANALRLGTIIPPAAPVAVPGAPGNLSGNYIYRVTFVTNSGETEAGEHSLVISVSGQQIIVNNIPISSNPAVTARKVYRSTGNDISIPILTKLLTTIADNTTTTYLDDSGDGLLGATEPSVNTTGGFIYYGSARSGMLDTQTTAFGLSALEVNAGLRNTAFGFKAMNITTTGSYNTAVGYAALILNTTGQYNSALGMDALHSNTSGFYNTAIGEDTLWNNTSGFNNTGLGSLSLRANTTGESNTGVGYGSLQFGTTGFNNTGMGTAAGRNVVTGSFNTFLGYAAGYDAAQKQNVINSMALGQGTFTTKDNQVVIGNSSVVETLLSGNVGIGTNSPEERLEVAGNLKLKGAGSGIVFPNGTIQTTAVTGGTITGVSAGTGLSGGGNSGTVNLSVDPSLVAFQSDLASETSQRQSADTTLQNSITAETNARTAADTSLQNNITAETNARTGADTTLQNNITGEANTRAAADTTLQNNITGEANTRAAAVTSLQTSITSESGTRATADTSLQNNIAGEASIRAAADTALQTGVNGSVGKAGDTMTGTLNLPTNGLLVGNTQLVLSGGNVGIGTTGPAAKLEVNGTTIVDGQVQAKDMVGTGDQLLLNGVLAGSNRMIAQIRSKDQVGVIDLSAGDGSIGTRIAGNGNSYFSEGKLGIGTTTPTSTLSVNGTASKPGGGSWDVFSDVRLKNIKGNFTSGLKAVMQLRPLRYEYKSNNPLKLNSDVEHIGFSAQAVQQVIPEAVTSNSTGYLMINNDPILWTMVNAIKEQQAQIQQQQELIKQQQTQAKRQQEEVEALKRLVCHSHRRSRLCK